MVFRKQKMIDRLTKEGLKDKITEEIIAIMDDLDGQRADENCWNRRVKGEHVYYVKGKSGKGEYVNEKDCE